MCSVFFFFFLEILLLDMLPDPTSTSLLKVAKNGLSQETIAANAQSCGRRPWTNLFSFSVHQTIKGAEGGLEAP
jgi:hypothetical protein